MVILFLILIFFFINLIPFDHNLNASKCIATIILNDINGCFMYDRIKFLLLIHFFHHLVMQKEFYLLDLVDQ